MKHLLSAIAMAALIGAVPAWAQTSSTDQSKQPMPQASSSGNADSSTMGKAHHRAAARGGGSAEDNMAEELNRQELERVQGGTPMGASGSSLPAAGAPRGAGSTGNLSDRAGSEAIGRPSPEGMDEHPGAPGQQ